VSDQPFRTSDRRVVPWLLLGLLVLVPLVAQGMGEPFIVTLATLSICRGLALELAIGTGRVALPLAGRGVHVDGIELSEAMVARMREKPCGSGIEVVHGDMARADAPRRGYRLVYLVFNTIYNLLTQDDQVRCFENAARHLDDERRRRQPHAAEESLARGRQARANEAARLGMPPGSTSAAELLGQLA